MPIRIRPNPSDQKDRARHPACGNRGRSPGNRGRSQKQGRELSVEPKGESGSIDVLAPPPPRVDSRASTRRTRAERNESAPSH
ncbi:hypothetical protein NL676_035706 [Syzygium grande]|nr:hypothetical protein NL676_035706 [Syzygium grande]